MLVPLTSGTRQFNPETRTVDSLSQSKKRTHVKALYNAGRRFTWCVLAIVFLCAPHRTAAAGEVLVRLTLRDAVQRAVAANPEVLAERLNPQRLEALVQTARGAYDPVIRLGGNLRRETRPSGSVLEAPSGRLDEHLANGYTGLTQRLPWQGIVLNAQVENTRISSTNPFLSLNPSYTTRLSFDLTIPLLRGAGIDAARTEILVRRRETAASIAALESRLADVITRVGNSYWQLVAARQSLAVAEQTRQAAAESLASTERLVREGEQSQAELAGAQGQLSRAEEAKADAEGAARQAENSLKSLLASSVNDDILAATLDLPDAEADANPASFDDLLRTAFDRRAELREAEQRIGAQNERTRLAANERLPRIDLQFGYVNQGLVGREQRSNSLDNIPIPGFDLTPPPGFAGSTWTGFRQIGNNRFPTYGGTLAIELPLRNRAADGAYAEARLAERQLRLQLDQAKIQIALDVRQAVASVAAARDRIAAAELAVQASSSRLESELRLFREGQSTNLNLNVRQNELSESRQLLVRARQILNSASADLLRATGSTLTSFGVRLQPNSPKK